MGSGMCIRGRCWLPLSGVTGILGARPRCQCWLLLRRVAGIPAAHHIHQGWLLLSSIAEMGRPRRCAGSPPPLLWVVPVPYTHLTLPTKRIG